MVNILTELQENNKKLLEENQQLRIIARDSRATIFERKIENTELQEEVTRLQKEVEEKELMIKNLESEIKIMEKGSLCHLDAIKTCEN